MTEIIDVHVHLPAADFLNTLSPYMEQLKHYFRVEVKQKEMQDVFKEFDEAGISKLVVLPIDASRVSKIQGDTNDSMARVQSKFPDRLLCFATVDPLGGEGAALELRRAIKELGLKGLKLHPQLQAFKPNDKKARAVYEEAERLQVPVVIHAGMVGVGAGMPGGAGLRLDYSRPIYIDDIAATYPELKIVMCHFGWPWVDEAIAIALHKENVYLDLSGRAPKYFPESLLRFMNGPLSGKVVFGTDYPMLSPSRWLTEFKGLAVKVEVREKVLYHNAARLLGLEK